MAVSAEVISFCCPNSERTNLYVSGINDVALSETDVYGKLEKIFSAFGLLFEVQVFTGNSKQLAPLEMTAETYPTHSYYAFVKFYSPSDARKAKEAVHKKYLIQGKIIKVSYSTRKRQDDYPLSYSRCCLLAQTYLGFKGWSSHVIQIHEDKQHTEPTLVRFLCATKLDFTDFDISTQGIGLAEERFSPADFRGRLEAIKKCRRLSYNRAMENAFQQVVLVVLSSGKVSVELSQQKPDQMIFMDEEIKNQLIQVKHVDGEEVVGGDESEIPKDGSLLDAMNEELLYDLMVDS